MALHIAFSAPESFISSFLERHEELHTLIKRITIVENADADKENFEDLEVIERFDYDYKKFANVDWETVDLYIYNDTLENLKFLSGAAAKSVLSMDLSGFAATLDQMPVVLPGVDTVQLEEIDEKSMVAVPHPQVSQLMYIIDFLRKQQQMLYVSVTNVFPVSEALENGVEKLDKQTRNFYSFNDSDEPPLVAFNVNALVDVDPSRQINFEAQIKRLLPEIDTISVHNIQAPVFHGTAQYVTVSLTNGNTIDQGIIDNWFGEVKDFEGINYQVSGSNPREFIVNETSNDCLVEFSNVSFTDNVKWQSVVDNPTLKVTQAIQLINLMIDEGFMSR